MLFSFVFKRLLFKELNLHIMKMLFKEARLKKDTNTNTNNENLKKKNKFRLSYRYKPPKKSPN